MISPSFPTRTWDAGDENTVLPQRSLMLGKIPNRAFQIVFTSSEPLGKALPSGQIGYHNLQPQAWCWSWASCWSTTELPAQVPLDWKVIIAATLNCLWAYSLNVYLYCSSAFRFTKPLRASLCYALFIQLPGDHHCTKSCHNKDKSILWAVQLMEPRFMHIWSLYVYPFPKCSLRCPNPYSPSCSCYRNTILSLQWPSLPSLTPATGQTRGRAYHRCVGDGGSMYPACSRAACVTWSSKKPYQRWTFKSCLWWGH